MNRIFGYLVDFGWRAFALLLAAFMGAPLVLVVLFSFNQSALTSLPLTGFTLDWYRKLFALGAFWPALWNSLIVAAFVAILSVAIGTMAALVLSRMASRRAEALIAIISVPMMLPDCVCPSSPSRCSTMPFNVDAWAQLGRTKMSCSTSRRASCNCGSFSSVAERNNRQARK